MAQRKKKVLIVSYFFPPVSGLGSFRIKAIAHELITNGWEVGALTVDERFYSRVDPSGLKDVEPSRIETIPYRPLNSLFKKVYLFVQFYRFLMRRLKVEKFDLLYFNGSPFYYFPFGRIAARRYGVPYALDFRDPWSMRGATQTNAVKKFFISLLESYAVSKASLVLHVTREKTEAYRRRYHKLPAGAFLTVENGFHEDDLKVVKSLKVKKQDVPAIVYPGKFTTYRSPENFFRAFERFLKTGANCRFIHVGQREKFVEDLVAKYNLGDHVTMTGEKSFRETLEIILSSHYGLLITSGEAWEPTTKIFDFLICKIPCIAVAHREGYVADVLRQTGAGFVVGNEENEIYESLLTLGDKKYTFHHIEKYSRQAHLPPLLEKLNRIVS